MDEPTSALTENEVEHLFDIMRELRAQGMGDHLHLPPYGRGLRESATASPCCATASTSAPSRRRRSSTDEIIRMMVGRPVAEYFGKAESRPGRRGAGSAQHQQDRDSELDPHKQVLCNVSLNVRAGEIVGLAGLVGSGRTDLARCIFGVDPRDSGEIFVNGQPRRYPSPARRHSRRHRHGPGGSQASGAVPRDVRRGQRQHGHRWATSPRSALSAMGESARWLSEYRGQAQHPPGQHRAARAGPERRQPAESRHRRAGWP